MAIITKALAVLGILMVTYSVAHADTSVMMLEEEGSCGIDKCKASGFWRDLKECVCKTCGACVAGKTYQKQACGGDADTQCLDCSNCKQDEYVTDKCGSKADTKCAKCKTCAAGSTQKTDCQDGKDRECKPCSKCGGQTKFAKDACVAKKDTVCADCKVCGQKQFQAKACSETTDRECQDCLVCDGTSNYEKVACSATANAQCAPCQKCATGQYEKTPCSASKDRTCEQYVYKVSGKIIRKKKTKLASGDLKPLKQTEMAHVRCVDDKKGASICTKGCSHNGKKRGNKPSYKCKTNFITTNGKGCKGACEPSDGKDMRTFEEAKKFCASIGMRLPSNEVELKRTQGTGCNFNGKEIWFDKK